jgi:prepilin-type N-terminal cleavage/methylation domain-containing protein
MRQTSRSSTRGFSLIELMLALALGLLITGAAVKLYSTGVDATWVIQQRAEMQQDLRAAENLILRDISLAGAGLTQVPGEGVLLPFATTPIYGCSTGAGGPVCPPNGAINYPCVGGACGAATPPTLYPIMPGYQLGIKPPASAIPSDIITVAYSDANLALSCYTNMTTSAGGTVLTFTAPPNNPLPGGCVLPPNVTYPQALNNNVNGLIPGDVVLLNTGGGSGGWAIGEVTAVTPAYPANNPPVPGVSTYSITFGNGDTLKLNQSAQTNDLSKISGGANPQAWRIYIITYYLQNWTDAAGLTTTILYRQVNGQPAVPLVDNIANMQFTYDTYNTSGTLLNATGDGGESIGIAPSSIRKVNIAHLTIHSQLYGTRSSLMVTQGFQSFDEQTSISARNMSYSNRY